MTTDISSLFDSVECFIAQPRIALFLSCASFRSKARREELCSLLVQR